MLSLQGPVCTLYSGHISIELATVQVPGSHMWLVATQWALQVNDCYRVLLVGDSYIALRSSNRSCVPVAAPPE